MRIRIEKSELNVLKKKYPEGTKVALTESLSAYMTQGLVLITSNQFTKGLVGKVEQVDEFGSVRVKWSNGIRSIVEYNQECIVSIKNQYFNDLLQLGIITKDSFDDFVNEWHETETNLGLHEYLGLTLEEYYDYINPKIYTPVVTESSLRVIKGTLYKITSSLTSRSEFIEVNTEKELIEYMVNEWYNTPGMKVVEITLSGATPKFALYTNPYYKQLMKEKLESLK